MSTSALEDLRRSMQGVDLDDSEAKKKGIELFKFDHVQRGWAQYAKSCEIGFYDASEGSTKAPVWFLEVPECDIDVPVTDELNMQMDESELRVTFGTVEGVWAMRFPMLDRFSRFRRVFFDKLFENMYGCENNEVNQKTVFGKDLCGRMFTDSSAPMDWELSDEEEEPQNTQKQAADEETVKKTNTVISSMSMGIGDKSYLFRGNEVDVLSNAQGCVKPDQVSFQLSLASGSTISPAKILLGQREKKMNILTTEHSSSLFHADVETGKVVTEWKFEKNGVDVPMVDIATKCKGAQNEDDSTLLSLDKNRLCRWDMRDPSGVVQDMTSSTVLDFVTGKDYSKGTDFTCIASAGDGSVAVGSADGRIRLYNDNQKLTRASTALTPVGVPITALDVTHDGQWVVATTDGFLQVSKTSAKDDKNNVINGFKKSLSSKQAPPKLLKLKPEDQAIVGRHPFKNAKFTFITEANHQERWIVASCGTYTILWNFRKVKVGRSGVKSHGGLTTITDYQMLEKAEKVVDSSFMHDKYSSRSGGESLVVATDHHVYSTIDE